MLASVVMAIGSSLKALHDARSRALATAAAKEAFENRGRSTELYSCSQDGTIRVWDTNTRECLRVMTAPSPVNTLAASGGMLYCSHDDGRCREWSLDTGEVTREFVHGVGENSGRVCASKDYLYSCMVSESAHCIKEFSLQTGECTRQFDAGVYVFAMCTRQDKLYASVPNPNDPESSAIDSSAIGEWHLDQGQGAGPPARTFEGHTDQVTAIFATKTRLLTGSEDGTVKEWSLESGKCTRTFPGHCTCSLFPASAVLAWNGLLYGSAKDGVIDVWSLGTGKLERRLVGHSDTVMGLTVLNGRLYSSSMDHSIKEWDMASGRLLHTFEGHEDYVFQAVVQLRDD